MASDICFWGLNTRREAWFAREVEECGYRGAEDVGVEDTRTKPSLGEGEGEVH